MNEKPIGLRTATSFAKFFLEHPSVANVWLFGSVAMWGDSDKDVDLILELLDAELAFEFLRRYYQYYMELRKRRSNEQSSEEEEDPYERLVQYRLHQGFSLLGWQGREDEYTQICWNGKWAEWDALCTQLRALEAEVLERRFFRTVDLFLMPQGWRKSWKVWELLPVWPAKRMWGFIHFHRVMVWQARRFDPSTGTFCKRTPVCPWQEELVFQIIMLCEKRQWDATRRQTSIDAIREEMTSARPGIRPRRLSEQHDG